MTHDDNEQLSRFLQQLREARVSSRDTDADRMIRDAVRDNPDASYLLVQRALLLEHALNAANAQIARLHQEARRTESEPGGFLGRSDPWATGRQHVPHQGRVPGAAAYQVPAASPGSGAVSSGSSFLGNIATTAAGVVAGSFLFRGIEHLLNEPSAAGGFHGPDVEPQAGQTLFGNEHELDASALWGQQEPVENFPSDDLETFGDDPFLDGPDDTSWV